MRYGNLHLIAMPIVAVILMWTPSAQGSKQLVDVVATGYATKSIREELKSKGVIAPSFGVEDVYEDIVTENGRRFAVCVACIVDYDND